MAAGSSPPGSEPSLSSPLSPAAAHILATAARRGAWPRRRWLAAIAALGGASLVGACSEPVPPLRVGTIVFPGYELMFMARELGMLDEHSVRLVELMSSTDNLRALAAEQIEARHSPSTR